MSSHEDDLPQMPLRDRLDELLQSAAWPEPHPGQLRRLERRWCKLSPARGRRKRLATIVCLVATAAASLVAISVWAFLGQAPAERPELAPAVPRPELPQPPSSQMAEGGALEQPSRETGSNDPTGAVAEQTAPVRAETASLSRPATTYEKLVFDSLTRGRRAAADLPDAGLVEAAIGRRLAAPEADLDLLSKPLLEARGSNECLLVGQIQRSSGPRRAAAIDLLGHVGTGRSLPMLAELAAYPETHAPAVRALAHLADSGTLAGLAAREPDEDLKRDLLAALVARGDAPSVGLYLEFVARPERAASALAALDRVADPPVGFLFELLNSPQQTQRSAAALVLGHIDRPEVSQRLIEMAIRDVQRREALLALAASPRPEASQFVALAQSDLSLAALTRAAQHSLKRFLPLGLEVNQP